MIHAPKIYSDPGNITIPIYVDEPAAAVRFKLYFDLSVTYVSIQAAVGGFATVNSNEAGRLLVIIDGIQVLPDPICTITLNVPESTTLVFEEATWSSVDAESNPLEMGDGEVLVEGEDMNVNVKWTDNNPTGPGLPAGQEIISYKIYQDTNVVGTPVAPASEFLVSNVATGQGDISFYATAVNIKGEGPMSNAAVVNTDLPLMLENVTATIV